MNLSKIMTQNLSTLKWFQNLQKPDENKRFIQNQIQKYLLLIKKWNQSYNLTAIKTIEEMLYQHIIDSLSVVEYLNGPNIIDVGTGAGLPGIPVAIVRPDWHITLIESNQKKTAFLQQTKIELKLSNITIIPKRIENTKIQDKANTIISRAYASLGVFLKTTQHLNTSKQENCRWIAMKSSCEESELKEVNDPFYIENIVPLNISGLNAKRELIIIRQNNYPTKGFKGLRA